MATCLVTGGAGFIGSHLAERLVERGDEVRVLDNFRTGNRDRLAAVADRVEVIEGDLADRDGLRTAVRGVDYVFHHAALTSVPLSVEDPLGSDEQNTRGTLNLLEACREAGRLSRFVYPGSTSAYGPLVEGATSERAPTQPISPYAVQKLAGEHYCLTYHHCYGLPSVVLRYFNIFGERQDPAGTYAAAVPRFVQRILRGEPPIVYGDGEQTRDFCHVANAVEANLLAAENPAAVGQLFNIASGEGISVLALIRLINELCGTLVEPEFHRPRPGDVKHSLGDTTLAREVLGFEITVDLREGLRRTIEWFRRDLSI